MTNRKNHNSIIFLTTLSVYLGLVLVGGVTPSVFAQAATNQHFDIKNEIEVKDDLDKKPDDNDLSNGDFPALFLELLDQIKREAADGKINLPLPADFGIAGDYDFGGGAVGSKAGNTDERLDRILRGAAGGRYAVAIHQIADLQNGYKSGNLEISADKTEWFVKVSFSKNKADQFSKKLNRKYRRDAARIREISVKQIYLNTVADSHRAFGGNNYVYVTMRLPRAAIDELLADQTAR